MSEKQQENPEISKIKDFMKDERFDDVVNIIALYLGDATDKDYLDRLEDVIETLMLLHGGRTVLRFLIERLIIDIPSLLENLSKRDSVLRYSFLLLLKSMCENECVLSVCCFLDHSIFHFSNYFLLSFLSNGMDRATIYFYFHFRSNNTS